MYQSCNKILRNTNKKILNIKILMEHIILFFSNCLIKNQIIYIIKMKIKITSI